MASLNLFMEAEHRPFLCPGGEGAALLVHGFPGTPAEIRPVAAILHEAGWTVQGILLPGFGSEIETLPRRQYGEWVEATRAALLALRQAHHPLLLVGYSMGGAVALQVAAAAKPDGLVLLAPFWQLGQWWHRMIWHLLKQPLRFAQPLKRANFSDPRLREVMGLILSGLDIDDPAVQAVLRQLPMPVGVLDQLLRLGHRAKRAARQVAAPTLVVQGAQDETVRPWHTRQLIQEIAGMVHYLEVEAGHDLTNEAEAHWPLLAQAVLRFAEVRS